MGQSANLYDACCEGNVLAITFKAPFINDTANLEELEDALRDVLNENDQRFILLDFAEVNLVVSRMINSLLLMVKRVRAEGGQVHLCNLDPKVERVFKTMKLDRVFDIYLDRKEGVSAMRTLEARSSMAQFA